MLMYTETELRNMLRASADRAPAVGAVLPDVRGQDRGETLDATRPVADRPRHRSRRVIAPLAVAAATVALAGAVTVLARQGSGSDGQPAAGGNALTTAAPTVGTPTVSAAAPRRSHQALTPVLDVATVKTSGYTENYLEPVGDDKHGQQVLHTQLAHDRTMNLVIAPAGAFDDTKISKSHPVSIAGTTGHYAVIELFPLSADGHGGSEPTGTIVFRTPDHHWAFAWLQAGTKRDTVEGSPVDDPSAILAGYERLHVTYVAGRYRTPLRLNYLPANARFRAADSTTESASDLSYASLTTQDGDKQLDVSLVQGTGGYTDGKNCSIKVLGCTTRFHRTLPGGRTLVVTGTGYSLAETKKVFDHVELAGDVADRSTYFTLADAIG